GLAAHALSQPVDLRLQLGDGRLRDGRPAARAPKPRVHRAVRVARLIRVRPDEAVEQLSLLFQGAVQRFRKRTEAARFLLPLLALGAMTRLTSLPLHQQVVHVLGLEQTRQTDELELLLRSGRGELTELPSVENDRVEVSRRAEALERELLLHELVAHFLLALGSVKEGVFQAI